MMLETAVTMPTPVKGAQSYKQRVKDMFTMQIPYTFSLYRFWWYWLFIPWVLPFQITYCCIILVELVLITILFPVACVPFLRFPSYLTQALCFGFGFVLALLGLIPQTYGDYCRKPRAKNPQQ